MLAGGSSKDVWPRDRPGIAAVTTGTRCICGWAGMDIAGSRVRGICGRAMGITGSMNRWLRWRTYISVLERVVTVVVSRMLVGL